MVGIKAGERRDQLFNSFLTFELPSDKRLSHVSTSEVVFLRRTMPSLQVVGLSAVSIAIVLGAIVYPLVLKNILRAANYGTVLIPRGNGDCIIVPSAFSIFSARPTLLMTYFRARRL